MPCFRLARVSRAGALTFTAAATGAADASVAWSLVEGAAAGAISASGVYTAPTAGGTYHVVATANADRSKSASATVTVSDAPPPPPPPEIAVTIAPRAVTLVPGASTTFTASVTGSTDARVSWSIAEGAAAGAIDASGAYTAPGSAGTFHVVATSVASAAVSDAAVVTVTKPVCVPTTCSAQKVSCGTIPDGCRGTLDCGPCSTGGSICADAGAPHHTLTGCGEIAAPGCYTLAADMRQTGAQCLLLRDTSNVELDCAGHAVSGGRAIQITNLSAFHVHGCTLGTEFFGFNITGATDGTIDGNDLRGGLQAMNATRLTIAANTVANQIFVQYGQNVAVRDNTITLQPGPDATAGMVFAQYGSGNRVLGNKMDGAWDGHHQAGADDGVILWDESGDVVDGNVIASVYDCGIETLGLIANTALTNNTIRHAGICGIGAWYYNSWRRNRISGNSAASTLQLFAFNRLGGLRPAGFDPQHRLPADTAIEFHDNVFERNSCTDPSGGLPSAKIPLYASMLYSRDANVFTVPGQRDPNNSEWNLVNNAFTANNFGTATQAPSFGLDKVPGAVVDGGGNVCGPPPSTPYPLSCGP